MVASKLINTRINISLGQYPVDRYDKIDHSIMFYLFDTQSISNW